LAKPYLIFLWKYAKQLKIFGHKRGASAECGSARKIWLASVTASEAAPQTGETTNQYKEF